MPSFSVVDEGDDSRSHLVERNLVWGRADEQDAGSRTSTRSVEAFLKKTAIAYHQNLSFFARISAVCNSSLF